MRNLDRLEKLLAIKKVRRQRSELAVSVAKSEADLNNQRRAEALEVIAQKETLSKGYASRRFVEISGSPLREHFFTTMAVGIFRQRRDIASQRLQLRRIEGDCSRSAEVLSEKKREALYCRLVEAEFSKFFSEEKRKEKRKNETRSEENSLEMIEQVREYD